jgi:2-oxoglutarate dehydrogenase E1 component
VPLIVFTPKSLLRHPECTSTIADFTEGNFREVIADEQLQDRTKVKRVLLCSGKIYYELEEARREQGNEHVSIVRVEQLYPFPGKQLTRLLEGYPAGVELVWVQEEPLNMGAATFIKQQFTDQQLRVISRLPSGVTAEGLTAQHKINQAHIIKSAFDLSLT